jgi:hypothetical protein
MRFCTTTWILMLASGLAMATAGCESSTGTPAATQTDVTGDTTADTTGDVTGDTTPGDTTPGDTVPDSQPGLLSCGQTSDCAIADCIASNGGAGCGLTCVTKLDPADKAKFESVWKCLNDECKDTVCLGKEYGDGCMDDCAGQHCAIELSACVDSGTPGTSNCGTSITCFSDCKFVSDPFACWDKCWNASSKAAQGKLETMVKCTDEVQGNTDPMQACGIQAVTCLADGKMGPKACYEVLSCMEGCSKGAGPDCVAACVSSGTEVAQQTFADLVPCLDQDMSAACMTKFVACAAPSGTKTCAETVTCIDDKCANSDGPSCPLTCAHEATPAEGKKFADMMECVVPCQDACNGDKACKNECPMGTCQTQALACMGNG